MVAEENPVFSRVANAGHADLITVERSYDEKADRWRGDIVVQDVRAVIDRFSKTAAEGGYRVCIVDAADDMRSEEHTSELQSLMRNSYAVFCLKKKKNKNNQSSAHQHTEK